MTAHEAISTTPPDYFSSLDTTTQYDLVRDLFQFKFAELSATHFALDPESSDARHVFATMQTVVEAQKHLSLDEPLTLQLGRKLINLVDVAVDMPQPVPPPSQNIE